MPAATAEENARTGLPIMRHLVLVHPDDPTATARDDEFLFGSDVLAAPSGAVPLNVRVAASNVIQAGNALPSLNDAL